MCDKCNRTCLERKCDLVEMKIRKSLHSFNGDVVMNAIKRHIEIRNSAEKIYSLIQDAQ